MQLKSSWLLDLGMWFLTHRRQQAMWWYNRTLPLFALVGTERVDEVLLVCRKD